MSDSKESEAVLEHEYVTKHVMIESHAALYKIFCDSRAVTRAMADAEAESRREEFLKTAHDAGMAALNAEKESAPHSESGTVLQLCDHDTAQQESAHSSPQEK